MIAAFFLPFFRLSLFPHGVRSFLWFLSVGRFDLLTVIIIHRFDLLVNRDDDKKVYKMTDFFLYK